MITYRLALLNCHISCKYSQFLLEKVCKRILLKTSQTPKDQANQNKPLLIESHSKLRY